MRLPWPWPNDLDTQIWPRYGQDVTAYQKWSFYVNWFKSNSPNRQIDRHTDTTKTLPLPHTREVIRQTVFNITYDEFSILNSFMDVVLNNCLFSHELKPTGNCAVSVNNFITKTVCLLPTYLLKKSFINLQIIESS